MEQPMCGLSLLNAVNLLISESEVSDTASVLEQPAPLFPEPAENGTACFRRISMKKVTQEQEHWVVFCSPIRSLPIRVYL